MGGGGAKINLPTVARVVESGVVKITLVLCTLMKGERPSGVHGEEKV